MAFNNILKAKKKTIFVHKCNWCNREITLSGPDYDTHVVNAEHKYFCIIQTPGKPAERDCLKDYLENDKKRNEHTFEKKLEEKKEQEEKEEEEKEKRIEARPRVLAKLTELDKFLKDKQFKNRIKDNQRFGTLPSKNPT